MRNVATGFILPGMFLLGLTGCDRAETLPTEADATLQAAITAGNCGLTFDLGKDANSYFSSPAKQAAKTLTDAIAAACTAENQAAVTSNAIQLLALMESVLEQGTGGSAAAGSAVANSALACTRGLCNMNDRPSPLINFAAAFGPTGTFAIRHGKDDVRQVRARGWVKFADQGPTGTFVENWALWGIDVDEPWKDVAKADPVLIYGWDTGATGTLDPAVGKLEYNFKRFPANVGQFQDDDLHVWVCFAETAALLVHDDDHDDHDDPELNGRMQREGVLLSTYEPKCPTYPSLQAASIFAPFAKLMRNLAPRSLFASAMRYDTRTPHVGGSPLDFSRFVPVAVNANALLEWEVPPASNVVVGGSLAPGGVKVKATTLAGTPMEKVVITLYVLNNSGAPAGAEVSNAEATTAEANGIATWPDASVNKPGGYIVCASGKLEGFTFQTICSDMFHAKKK